MVKPRKRESEVCFTKDLSDAFIVRRSRKTRSSEFKCCGDIALKESRATSGLASTNNAKDLRGEASGRDEHDSMMSKEAK